MRITPPQLLRCRSSQRLQTDRPSARFVRPPTTEQQTATPSAATLSCRPCLIPPPGWNVQLLMATANTVARETDDFSLVGPGSTDQGMRWFSPRRENRSCSMVR